MQIFFNLGQEEQRAIDAIIALCDRKASTPPAQMAIAALSQKMQRKDPLEIMDAVLIMQVAASENIDPGDTKPLVSMINAAIKPWVVAQQKR